VRVLVDTNVVLDVLLNRKPFAQDAAEVFALVETSVIKGFLCATTVTTLDYLLRQTITSLKARQALKKLLDLFEIAPVNRPVLEQALGGKVSDFEDAVLEQSGLLAAVDVITTRNTKHFRKSSLIVLDPAELLSTVRAAASADVDDSTTDM
jgi:predicted nucleic acid-binding protein